MNRIYQGKVTKVEIPDGIDESGKTRWKPLDDWQSALWRHHVLFQDAVNYYTVALAAMAADIEENSMQANALRGWATKVRETWYSANRKAETFDGPQARLALILKLESDKCSFETAAKRILQSSRATPAQRSAALLQLLDEADKGDLNKVCGERIAFLCPANPRQKKRPTSKAISSVQELKRQLEVRKFHQMLPQEALKEAAGLNLGLFLTQPSTEFLEGTGAVKELQQKFSKAVANFPELKMVASGFKTFLAANSTTLKIPPTGRKPSGLYPVATVFKFYPCEESLRAFLQATKTLANTKDKTAIADAIAEARVDDQPHFNFFTNLALVSGDDGECDTRAVWFEFDLAAFVEAIKAPHRYFQDTIKRTETAGRLTKQIASMDGKGHETSGVDDDSEPLPGFEGDERIRLLRVIVQDTLKWVAEVEGDIDEAVPKEYTISERTVRGFGEIRKRWRAAVETGKATEKRLLEILAEEQTEHRDDFGSATLYRELAKPEFHPIWRDGGTQPWHAEDPLAAWLDYKELQSELQDKERPIRFTPAHPKYSPRFFIFPKKSETQPKTLNMREPKPGLLSRHEPGQLSFTAGVVLSTAHGLMPTVVRIHYVAPRICRDKLRSGNDVNLYEAPWLQPMMVALGLDKSPDRVNFANCRITLQPANESDIQLTFPIEVNTEKIRATVAREAFWEKQFNLHPDGDNFYNASLRWPHEKQPAKALVPWHKQIESFRCVATDLGQRDAGAFARLLVRSDGNFGLNKKGKPVPTRFIGSTGSKEWCAALERIGLFCLPGEDARVWREISSKDKENPKDSGKPFDFRDELWGERGRPAQTWELEDTTDLMRSLEAIKTDAEGKEKFTLLPEGWDVKPTALSFPEQNDKLLVAMRRYQSKLARLHRWCWFLQGDDKQRDTAWKEVFECEDVWLITPELKTLAGKRDPRVLETLKADLCRKLQLVPELLVRIANRILPLRGRSWLWEPHPASKQENRLHHLTQNGPSLDSKDRPVWLRGQRGLAMERIEQIEELRKRFQSLNQAMRREVCGKPPIRRDETVPDTCPDLLEKLGNTKEQRINQTAHAILAEALGLRLAPPPNDKKAMRQTKDLHGVYEDTG